MYKYIYIIHILFLDIPIIDNLNVTDRCTSVTARWGNTEGPCGDISYNVTLLSSDGVILGPFTTTRTNYNFTNDVDTITGNISIKISCFTTYVIEDDHPTKRAVIDVPQSG